MGDWGSGDWLQGFGRLIEGGLGKLGTWFFKGFELLVAGELGKFETWFFRVSGLVAGYLRFLKERRGGGGSDLQRSMGGVAGVYKGEGGFKGFCWRREDEKENIAGFSRRGEDERKQGRRAF